MARRVGIQLVVTGSQQARQVLDAFSRDLGRLQAQANALYQGAAKFQTTQFPGAGLASQGKGGLSLGLPSQDLKVLANTIKVVNDSYIRLADGTKLLSATTTNYTGDLSKVISATQRYDQALEFAQGSVKQMKDQVAGLRNTYQSVAQAQDAVANKARQGIATAQARLSAVDERILGATQRRDAAQSSFSRASSLAGYYRQEFAGGNLSQAQMERANLEVARAARILAREEANLATVTAGQASERRQASAQLINSTNELNKATEVSTAAEARYAASRQLLINNTKDNLRPLLASRRQDVVDAYNAPPPLPPVLQQLAQPGNRGGSPALLRQLLGGGLGGGAQFGTPQFMQNLIGQGAYEGINIEKDLVRNVTRVTGAFNDAQGVVNRFSAEYDKAGKVITRFGGQLSGVGNILNQISRDFQKVIEFAIATTVVFGALRFAIEELRTITEIDKSLRQLGVTANLTGEEIAGIFEDISDVAVNTATPLTELVKATDDIALATREAGKTTKEWRADILSLTNSVGILTNLAGIDTVQATDVLVASMKQLGLEADQLPGILNKVTAVAGGQSNAIADVIKGLSVMAEAGKQAGLSIDEQIAAVQTLSQVTSKSPAEVATAFKNLVGSISGPAGTKALDKFNIALLDSSGNLRNIIDIYSEISDKISKGIIPENEVQGLVRAIAGGPRRAPDAAALLSSIGDIQRTAEKSINATNEALIANAKILDSNQAKLVQFQNRIDKFATTKFAEIINQSLTKLAEILDVVISFLERVPTEVITNIIQFGLLAAAVKFATSVFNISKNSILSVIAGFTQLQASLGATTLSYKELAAAQAAAGGGTGLVDPRGRPIPPTPVPVGRLGRLGRGLRPGLPSVGAGLAVGALGAAGGLDPLGAVGSGLQSGGLYAALSVPIPHIKALGVAAFALGTAMQFFGGETDKATDKVESNTEAILNSLTAYKTSAEELKIVVDAQKETGQQIDRLLAKEKLSADETSRLTSLQKDYGEGAASLIGLNAALAESFDTLVKATNGKFGNITGQAIAAGAFTPEQLKDIMNQLAPEILKATNPEFQAPADFKLPDFDVGRFAQREGSTTGQIKVLQPKDPYDVFAVGEQFKKETFDLKSLETDFNSVKKLFNEAGTSLNATFAPTYENLQLIDTALLKIKDSLDPAEYERLRGTFQGYASDVNALFAAERNVALYSAYLEAGGATGLFTQEEVTNGKAILTLYQQLIALGPSLPTDADIGFEGAGFRPRATDRPTQEGVLESARNFAIDEKTGLPRQNIDREQAIEFGTELFKANGQLDDLEAKGTVIQTIAALFIDAGIAVKGLTDSVEELNRAGLTANDAIIEGLEKLNNETIASTGEKLAELQAQFQAGEFKGKEGEYERAVAQLEAIAETTDKVVDTYIRAAEVIPNLDVAMGDFAGSLVNINGLQDAQSLSTDELIARLFTLAETYGLTGEQVVQLGDKLIGLFDIIKKINAIKARFNIAADVDVSKAIGALKIVRAASLAATLGTGVSPQTGPIDQAIADLTALQNSATSFSSSINNLYERGAGTAFPGPRGSKAPKARTPKTPQGPDVSTLDIPEEILKASNTSALLQEAIRRARRLQSQIPGATAEGKNDIVALLKGTQKILEVRGIKDDLLRKALEELAEIEKKRLEFETKADTIRRIRVGNGSFAALANVPLNSRTGVSLGGAEGPINVSLNINGTVLTPAQLAQFADLVAAAIKRQIAN